MKWFAVLTFTLTFTLSAATQSELDLTARIYNEKIKTADGLIKITNGYDKRKGDALGEHIKSLKISEFSKLPELIVVKDYLTFKDYKGPDFKMLPLPQGGIRIEFDGKVTEYNITMDLSELDKSFIVSPKSKEIRETMIDFIFAPAEAEDLGTSIRLLGGSAGFDMRTSTFGTATAVDEMHVSLKQKYKNWQHNRIREDAEEACKEVQEGKKIKSAEKLTEKLNKVKKEIHCITYWPDWNIGSCAYYDQKIACLVGASDMVNNNPREAKPVAPSNSSNKTPAASGVQNK